MIGGAGLGTMMVRIGADTGPLEKGLGKTKKLVKGFGIAAVGIGVGVAAGVAGAIKSFADFDAALQQSVSIMGDVSSEMRTQMSDAAREIAKTTKFSAAQAAESYYFLASAGLNAEQSIAALPAVAEFAQAGMFDMALATDLLTDAQSALGLSSKDTAENLKNMTRVSDVLVKANTLANASVQQFSEALTNKAGAALKLLGKDVEEGVAVLAAFADQGVKGSEAGERLNIVLRDLQTASIKNKDTWEEMGLAVYDSAGEMRNIADIVGDLTGVLEGASDEQARLTLMSLGFQDRSVSAIMTLLGLEDKIRDYESALRKAGGTTKDVASKQMDTLNAQLGLLKDGFKDLALEVGQAATPLIRDLVGVLQRSQPTLQRWTEQLAGGIRGLVGGFRMMFGLDDDLRGFTAVYEEFGQTGVSVFKTLGTWIERARDLFTELRPTIERIGGKVWDGIKLGAGIIGRAFEALDNFMTELEHLEGWKGADLGGKIKLGLGFLTQELTDWYNSTGSQTLKDFGSDLATGAISILGKSASTIGKAIGGAFGLILRSEELKVLFYAAGSDIARGIAEALWGAIKAEASSEAYGAGEAIAGALGWLGGPFEQLGKLIPRAPATEVSPEARATVGAVTGETIKLVAEYTGLSEESARQMVIDAANLGEEGAESLSEALTDYTTVDVSDAARLGLELAAEAGMDGWVANIDDLPTVTERKMAQIKSGAAEKSLAFAATKAEQAFEKSFAPVKTKTERTMGSIGSSQAGQAGTRGGSVLERNFATAAGPLRYKTERLMGDISSWQAGASGRAGGLAFHSSWTPQVNPVKWETESLLRSIQTTGAWTIGTRWGSSFKSGVNWSLAGWSPRVGSPGEWRARYAEGGIVTKPTMALIGEAGPEAVVPLKKDAVFPHGLAGMGGVTIINNIRGNVVTQHQLDKWNQDSITRARRVNPGMQ